MNKIKKIKTLQSVLNIILNKQDLLLKCFDRINKNEKRIIFNKEKIGFKKKYRASNNLIKIKLAHKVLKTTPQVINILIKNNLLETTNNFVYKEDLLNYVDLIIIYEKMIQEQIIKELARQKKVFRIIDTSQSKLGSSQRILLFELFADYFSNYFKLVPNDIEPNEKKVLEYLEQKKVFIDNIKKTKLDLIKKKFYEIDKLLGVDN